MHIPPHGGRPTNRSSASPTSDVEGPAPAPDQARARRPTSRPDLPREGLVTLAGVESRAASPATSASSTSRAQEDPDEIVVDPVRLDESAGISRRSEISGQEQEAPVSTSEMKAYLNTSDLKNYLQYNALRRFASDPNGADKLKLILNHIKTALPEKSPSRRKISKLNRDIFRTLAKIEANHDKYLALLSKRRKGGWGYTCSLGRHLSSKDSTWQFASRAFLAAGAMGITSLLMQHTYALVSVQACKDALVNLSAGNGTSPIPGASTGTYTDPTTSVPPVSTDVSPETGAMDIARAGAECDINTYLKSAYLPKGTSPTAAIGADLVINLGAGTLAGTLDGRNETALQAKNRARNREAATRRPGEAPQSTWYQRGGSAAGQAWRKHFGTGAVGFGTELGVGWIRNDAVTSLQLGRAAAVHFSGSLLNTMIDAGRDAFFPNASESKRYWGKIATRILAIPVVRQVIRSAFDGEDKYGYLSNIFAYGLVLGVAHELEGALFYSLRENNTPPDERAEHHMANLIMQLGKLGIELENQELKDDHDKMEDSFKANMPESMEALTENASDIIRPYFAELLAISDMLPDSAELRAAAEDLDKSIPKDASEPSSLSKVRNRMFGAPERERDIELGDIEDSGPAASSHTETAVADETTTHSLPFSPEA